MYLIDFDIVAIMLSIITLYLFYIQKKLADTASRWFELLLWSILSSAVFDTVSSLLINALPHSNRAAVIATTTALYLSNTVLMLVVAWYVATVGALDMRRRMMRVMLMLPWLISVTIILLNVPFGIAFYIDEAGVYRRGPMFPILYMFAGMYMLFVLWTVAVRRSGFSKAQRTAILPSLILPITAMVIQNVVPGMMFEAFAASLAALFVLLTIQNNDELLDGQTGLYNRDAFIRRLREAFGRSRGFHVVVVHSREISALKDFLDVHLYGHLIRSFASWLSRLAGPSAFGSALDDGLYVLLLERSVRDTAVGELVISIVRRSAEVWKFGSTEVELPVRVGILQCPQECRDVSDVMDLIDQLSMLPDHTENRHVFYARDFVLGKHRSDAEIAYRLKETIAAGTPELQYQPLYATAEGRITALEVLVRLGLENGELAAQSDVMRIAERTGRARALADLVLERSCEWFVQSGVADLGIEHLQVRLLGSKYLDLDWPYTVLKIARSCGMELSRLCLEVTEPAVVNTWGTLRLNMELLAGQGVCFALDDFGAGYTDLLKILDFPASVVKLDKRIVWAGLRHRKGQQLLAGSISLFRRLGRKIVAEGVETAEQAGLLAAMGCDYLQGYRYGRPMSGDEILTLLNGVVEPNGKVRDPL
jgi:EAL domain-containing protein (putative c-di-GMP-specific phosphodiesterase class I)/GGDEF domain-containing protein